MTQEEKAKAYDEALKFAMIYYKSGDEDMKTMMKTCFPVLVEESEDEKIKEDIKYVLANTDLSKVSTSFADMLAWLEKQGEQKPAWSEENEVKINRIVGCLENLNVADNDILLKDVDWLNSLKERVPPQSKQEWSEEDENTRKKIIKFLKEQNYFDGKVNEFKEPYKKEYEWLKSLRPQNTWKPSDEQMRVFDLAIRCGINRGTTEETTLVSLFNDLKKLREE